MRLEEILAACDHTVLDRCATVKDIETAVDDGIKYSVASVCIPPCYVKHTSEYAKARLAICTVIGFPNGYSSTAAKVSEARLAALDGADEIDMVINLGLVKAGNISAVIEEINAVKDAVGDRILKVIIETCLLTDEEKLELCEAVSESRADFIKTSTGFSTGGATLADIELMAKHMKNGKKIKAAGGISSFADAEAFLNAGASRLGTSRLVKLLKNGLADGY